jgi:hypothetical protein
MDAQVLSSVPPLLLLLLRRIEGEALLALLGLRGYVGAAYGGARLLLLLLPSMLLMSDVWLPLGSVIWPAALTRGSCRQVGVPGMNSAAAAAAAAAGAGVGDNV